MQRWQLLASARLLDYENLKQAIANLPQEIRAYKWAKNASKAEKLECMTKQKILRERLRRNRRWVAQVQKGLAVLTPEERMVVQLLYIAPGKGNATRLCEWLDCSQSTVYRRRDRALEKFTTAIYGRGS